MDITKIEFLRRLINDQASERASSKTAQHFHEAYRLGERRGSRYLYSLDDLDFARNLLRTHGADSNGDRQWREDRAAASSIPGISEKSARNTPRASLLAIRALNEGCKLNGQLLAWDFSGYLVMEAQELNALEFDLWLVIENMETVKQLHRYRWLSKMPAMQGARVLAIYRGDSVYRGSTARQAIDECPEQRPVWSFPDVDPAGLGLASQIPRLRGLALPWEGLEGHLRRNRRTDLYADQLSQWSSTLEGCKHPDITRAWGLVRAAGCGLNQEALRDL